MSEGNVAILNTKLDILIDDFKSFKQLAIGFIMTIVVPFAVYMTIQIVIAQKDIAVVQEKLNVSTKAIKQE